MTDAANIHNPNVDAKLPPKRVYLITCKGGNTDGKQVKASLTYDKKDAAFKAASKAVDIGLSDVRLMQADVTWEPVEPEAEPATSKKLLKRYMEREI